MTDPKHPGPQPQAAKDPGPTPPIGRDHQATDKPKADPPGKPTAIDNCLAQLDAHIRTSLKLPGGEGSGLYTLLDNLSMQNLGTPRSAPPTPLANNPGDYYRQQAPLPGVPGSSPPGPLPGPGRGQSPGANSSGPLQS